MTGAFKLVWFAIYLSSQGPQTIAFIDETPFKADAECAAFGGEMKGRTADFVRGMFNVPWAAPVQVAFKCEPNGQPA